MAEANITRQEVITLVTVETNNFGDLLFTDQAGTQHKIAVKRVNYFKDIIKENAAVQLNYAEAYGKEYIYNAVSVGDQLPAPVPTKTTGTVKEIPPREPPPPNPQAVGMVTKELGDMIRSKYIKPIFGDIISTNLIKWYRYQVLGITRIDFDSADLPSFEKREVNME